MRTYIMTSARRTGLAAAALVSSASLAAAQLPSPSAAAFGMGGNFTAIARGYEAISWNPANLAMPGRPIMSLGLGVVGGSFGLDPIDITTMHSFAGKKVDSVTRVDWMEQVKLAGRQRTRLDAGMTPIALTVGPIGLQVGTTMYTNLDLSPDAWEAVLFGNAGNNNEQAKTLDFSGTSVRVGATSAAAMSFALPIPINFTNGGLANERAAIGLNAKYVMGHALIIADDAGSTLGQSDMQFRFPVIAPDTASRGNVGNGMGVDLALAWSGGPWKFGVMAENLYNAFAWDTTMLVYLPGTGSFSSDGSTTEPDFDQQSYSSAPKALRDIVAGQKYHPAIGFGAAFEMGKSLTLTADFKTHMGDDNAIIVGPKTRMGVGAEYRLLPFLPLRGGFAAVTDGWQAGAGFGLGLFGYEFGVATSIRRRGNANESGLMIGLIGLGR